MKKNTERQDTKFETIELEGSVQDPKWKKAVEKSLRRAMTKVKTSQEKRDDR